MIEDFTGRVAVVTGGASGIGKALAVALGEAGARLVLADVEGPALAAASGELASRGFEVLPVVTDVRHWESVEALASATIERYGTVHLVCNNAGVGGGGVIRDISLKMWRWVIDVNLWGVIHGVHAFLPHLLAHGEPAHIVNTASLAGLAGSVSMGPYCASKFAVVGLSESLSAEMIDDGANVGVSVLCPGYVRTNIATSQRNRPAELRDTGRPKNATGRDLAAEVQRMFDTVGKEPDEVAALVLDAVRHDRFWVFSHPDMLGDIEARFERMMRGENPVVKAGA